MKGERLVSLSRHKPRLVGSSTQYDFRRICAHYLLRSGIGASLDELQSSFLPKLSLFNTWAFSSWSWWAVFFLSRMKPSPDTNTMAAQVYAGKKGVEAPTRVLLCTSPLVYMSFVFTAGACPPIWIQTANKYIRYSTAPLLCCRFIHTKILFKTS